MAQLVFLGEAETRPALNMSQPTVAIIGASANRAKYGNKSLRAHLRNGYDVYAVNPKGGEIEGLTVYRTLAEVPVEHFSRISLYVPPHVGITLLDEIAAKGCDELWLNPGSESPELLARASQLGLDPIQACSIIDVESRTR
jgi:predicted CoA-binding protein